MSSNTDSRDSRRLSGDVAPGDTETWTWELDQDATVEEVAVRFYPGPQLDLHVIPFAEVNGPSGTRRRRLVNFAEEDQAKEYIDGNDERLTYDVSQPVERTEVVGVEVENLDDQHKYDCAMDVTVDYEGGTNRWFASLADRIRGVF